MLKIYLICDDFSLKLKMIYPILKYLHKDFLLIKEQKNLFEILQIFQILKDYKDYKDYFFYFYINKNNLDIEGKLQKFFKLNIKFGIINKNHIFLINFPKRKKIKTISIEEWNDSGYRIILSNMIMIS